MKLTSMTAALLVLAAPAFADDEACQTVHLSDPGWTDITATNGVASVVLAGLGYEADIATLSVPDSFATTSGRSSCATARTAPTSHPRHAPAARPRRAAAPPKSQASTTLGYREYRPDMQWPFPGARTMQCIYFAP